MTSLSVSLMSWGIAYAIDLVHHHITCIVHTLCTHCLPSQEVASILSINGAYEVPPERPVNHLQALLNEIIGEVNAS
jgi:hypothetical protein